MILPKVLAKNKAVSALDPKLITNNEHPKFDFYFVTLEGTFKEVTLLIDKKGFSNLRHSC